VALLLTKKWIVINQFEVGARRGQQERCHATRELSVEGLASAS
jgi:hypothetical protein